MLEPAPLGVCRLSFCGKLWGRIANGEIEELRRGPGKVGELAVSRVGGCLC